MNRPWLYYPINLTWEGHEFLDAARDESIWEKALGKLNKKGLPITLELLKFALAESLKVWYGT